MIGKRIWSRANLHSATVLLALAAIAAGLIVHEYFLLAAAVLAGSGIVRKALRSLRYGHMGIELLVTAAAVGGILLGEYFEAAAVTTLFAVGGWLETLAMRRTRNALQRLLQSIPDTATLLRDGSEQVVAIHELQTGDTVLVRPGERIPVDGTVIGGTTTVDESTITGESMPSEKAAGSQVFSATMNQFGAVKVRTDRIGSDTTIAGIIARVEEAQDARPRGQRMVEHFARIYTPAVLVGSVIWFSVTGDVHTALTLLVVSCPGAMVLAAPSAVVTAIGRAARRGVLIRGGAELERLARIRACAMDKTGTLTTGNIRVQEVVALESALEAGISPLYWAGIAESNSEHPIGRAIREHARVQLGDVPSASDFVAATGVGVRARYNQRRIRIERPDPQQCDEQAAAVLLRLQRSGATTVAVLLDDNLIGLVALADTVREDAHAALLELQELGVTRTILLTGDSERAAAAIAEPLGIQEVHAGLLPQQKLEHVHQLMEADWKTALIGDGMNDAPALAAADIGISMGIGGTDLANDAADVALMSERLLLIPAAIRIARHAVHIVRWNLAIAMLTVLLLIAGVLTGNIHMAGGMLIHQGSILLVILNGVRRPLHSPFRRRAHRFGQPEE